MKVQGTTHVTYGNIKVKYRIISYLQYLRFLMIFKSVCQVAFITNITYYSIVKIESQSRDCVVMLINGFEMLYFLIIDIQGQ